MGGLLLPAQELAVEEGPVGQHVEPALASDPPCRLAAGTLVGELERVVGALAAVQVVGERVGRLLLGRKTEACSPKDPALALVRRRDAEDGHWLVGAFVVHADHFDLAFRALIDLVGAQAPAEVSYPSQRLAEADDLAVRHHDAFEVGERYLVGGVHAGSPSSAKSAAAASAGSMAGRLSEEGTSAGLPAGLST